MEEDGERQITVGLVEYTRLHYYCFYQYIVVFVILLCIHFLIVLYLSTHLMYAHISLTFHTLYMYTDRFLPMSLCLRANPVRCHSFSNKCYITDSLLLSRMRLTNRCQVNKWWQTGRSEQADQFFNWQLHSPEIAKSFFFFFFPLLRRASVRLRLVNKIFSQRLSEDVVCCIGWMHNPQIRHYIGREPALQQ